MKTIHRKHVQNKGALVILLSSFLALSACGTDHPDSVSSSNDSDGNKIEIVAAENFYGEVASAVGGKYVSVTSLLTSPDADPHDYEPTPEASEAVDRASIVIFNGIGYDEWTQKLIDASGHASGKSVIRVASDVMGHKEGDNEHVWYNPETMSKYADYLADQLGRIDPKHKAEYTNQAIDYKQSLSPLKDAVASLKQAEPVPAAVSEPVFDYMAQALNFQITDERFGMAAEEETDPSPRDIAALQNDIKEKKIKLFINNIQASSPTVQNIVDLANKNDIPVIEVTETLPAGMNYLQWMTGQLQQIEAALKS